jgi:hypothetical protein
MRFTFKKLQCQEKLNFKKMNNQVIQELKLEKAIKLKSQKTIR